MERNRICIVTHVDVDAVISAAIYITCSNVDVENVKAVFVAPRDLPKALEQFNGAECSKVVVMDLAPNASNYHRIVRAVKKLVSKGIAIEWYDHHVWERKWIEELSQIGVDVVIDRSTCAAGVVEERVCRGLHRDLAKVACSVDLWKFDEWKSNYLYRVVEKFSSEKKWFELVREIVENGIDDVLKRYEHVVEDVVSKELSVVSDSLRRVEIVNVNGLRVCIYVKSEKEKVVSTSLMCNAFLGRNLCDIAIVVRRDLKSLSLRSRRCDVREIAKALGGGGHPRAAGAPFPRSSAKLLAILGRILGLHSLRRAIVIRIVSKKVQELRNVIHNACT